MQSAEQLSERSLQNSGSDVERLAALIKIAYGRDATADELLEQEKFFGQLDATLAETVSDPVERKRQAWIAVCHTVLASNEFIFVK